MTRLVASPPDAEKPASAVAAGNGSCRDCGGPIDVPIGFCGSACRKRFNNRRMARGAVLYDLFMATRFDQPLAKRLKLWRLLNRLAAAYREEDRIEREGRQSWRDPKATIADRPWLVSTVNSVSP